MASSPISSAGSASPAIARGDDIPRARFILTGMLLAGAVLRLLLWICFQDVPLHVWDEREYDDLAKNLVQHGQYTFTEPGYPKVPSTSLRPPLYPAFLAGVYQIFDIQNYQAVRLIQAMLGLLTAFLLYRLGKDVESRRLGLWLAGFFCFYPSMLGTANLLLTETLFTLLLCTACYAIVLFYKHDSLWCLGGAGILLGLAALTRSVVWLSPPFLALFVFFTWKASFSRRLWGAALLVVSFAAVIAPWSFRNSQLEKTFVVVDTMGGRNFMMGNYRYTPLYRSWDAIGLEGEKSWHYEVAGKYSEDERISQGAIDKLALKLGLEFVRENPGLTLKRDLIKFFDFWGLERELIAGVGRGFWGGMPSWGILLLAGLIFGSYALAMVMGIFGMMMVPLGDGRFKWFFLLVIAYVCGMHTLVFAHSRYHLPIMPLVLLFAANAWIHRTAICQQKKSWRFVLSASFCFILVLGWGWGLLEGDMEKLLRIFRST